MNEQARENFSSRLFLTQKLRLTRKLPQEHQNESLVNNEQNINSDRSITNKKNNLSVQVPDQINTSRSQLVKVFSSQTPLSKIELKRQLPILEHQKSTIIQKISLQKKNKENSMKLARDKHINQLCLTLALAKSNRGQTVIEIFRQLVEYVNQLVKVKNERFIVNLMIRHSFYNAKIKDLIQIFPQKPSTWTSDNLIRSVVQHHEEESLKYASDQYKKFRVDFQLIDAVGDLIKSFEDCLTFQLQDRMNTTAENFLKQQAQVELKERIVKNHMIENKKTQQLYYLNELINSKKAFNIRALETDIIDRLQKNEEKLGKFHIIQNITRNASSAFDQALFKIKLAQKRYEE